MTTDTPSTHAMYVVGTPNDGYDGVENSAMNDYNGKKATSDSDYEACCDATLASSKVSEWTVATTNLATK